jgi:hypothetical protein
MRGLGGGGVLGRGGCTQGVVAAAYLAEVGTRVVAEAAAYYAEAPVAVGDEGTGDSLGLESGGAAEFATGGGGACGRASLAADWGGLWPAQRWQLHWLTICSILASASLPIHNPRPGRRAGEARCDGGRHGRRVAAVAGQQRRQRRCRRSGGGRGGRSYHRSATTAYNAVPHTLPTPTLGENQVLAEG